MRVQEAMSEWIWAFVIAVVLIGVAVIIDPGLAGG